MKLIRAAIRQAQSEGEHDAAKELLDILKTLDVAAPVIESAIVVTR